MNVEGHAHDDFARHAREIRTSIVDRLDTYEQVFRGGRGLFVASKRVTRDKWGAYVSALKLDEHYPGILGVGYAMSIAPSELKKHEALIRGQGFPDYAVHPIGARDTYTSIIYLEPFSPVNRRAFGYDMWSDPVRREAMARARDSGTAAMSGKVLLVQEAGKNVQAGFLIYLPVYRKGMPIETLEERRQAIDGWVYSPFRMNDLMRGILGEREGDFDIEIFDGEAMLPDNRLYESFVRFADAKGRARFRSVRHIEISGHPWTLEISSLPGFESRIERGKARDVALGGIAISVLLFLISWLLVHGHNRAVRIAREMNRELIESESRFRALYDNVPAGVVSVDPVTNHIVQANRKFSEITGYPAEELNGMNPLDLIHPEDRQDTGTHLQGLNRGEVEEFRIEKRFLRKDGSVFWGETLATVLRGEDGRITRYIAIVADIEERKRWELALRASERRLHEIVDLMPVALFIKDPLGRIKLMNRACEAQWGMAFVDLQNTDGSQFFPPEQMDAFVKRDREVFAGGVQVDFEQFMWNAGLNENRTVHAYKRPIYDEDGKPLYLIGILVDVTEQKAREEALSLAGIVFDSADEGITITDADNTIVRVNPSFTAITGYEADEVMGKNPKVLASGKHDEAFYRTLWEKLDTEGAWRGEIWNRRKNGEIYIEWLSIKALKDESGKNLRFVAMFSDITQRKEDAERFRYFAHYDVLTGLPNRLLFGDRLHQALSQARREKSELAVLFIDLDKFKPVNDTFGHHVGDMLLKEVADRLADSVRESDTVSRLGGDEFVVLLLEMGVTEDAESVAEKILTAISAPYVISGHVISVSASIGIALYPEHGDTDTDLMKRADIAMYQAKKDGRSKVRLYRAD